MSTPQNEQEEYRNVKIGVIWDPKGTGPANMILDLDALRTWMEKWPTTVEARKFTNREGKEVTARQMRLKAWINKEKTNDNQPDKIVVLENPAFAYKPDEESGSSRSRPTAKPPQTNKREPVPAYRTQPNDDFNDDEDPFKSPQ